MKKYIFTMLVLAAAVGAQAQSQQPVREAVGEKVEKVRTAFRNLFERTDEQAAEDAAYEAEEAEAARLDKERQAAEKAAAEANAQAEARQAEEAAAAKAAKAAEETPVDPRTAKAQSAMQGLFGNGNASSTWNYEGHGTVTATWTVYGRKLIGELPKPDYDHDAVGTVVVMIRLDKDGRVVSATRADGSTTDDVLLVEFACEAARRAAFTTSDDPSATSGTITYVFRR